MSKSAFRLALAALFIASVRGNNCVKIEYGNRPVCVTEVGDSRCPVSWPSLDGPVPDRIKDLKVVKMAIGVKQQNVQTLEEKLMASADTTKPTYGKHMSNDEVQELTRPSKPHLDAVKNWLASAHAQLLPDLTSSNEDVIAATVSLNGAAHLLHTPYHLFVKPGEKSAHPMPSHGTASQLLAGLGDFVVGSNSTSICVPKEVYNAVDYISHEIVDKADLAAASLPSARRRLQKEEATTSGPADYSQGVPISIGPADATWYEGKLQTYVNNPQTTRYLYNMPRDEFGDWKSKVAVLVVESKLSNFLLGFYWNVYCFEIDCGAEPKTESNPMGYPKTVEISSTKRPYKQDGESQLDIEAITAMATGVHTEFWNDNMPTSWRINCPASGAQMAWNSIEFFLRVSSTSDVDVPKAFSDSWLCLASQPSEMTAHVQRRMNTEYMKLGARGISYIASTGDDGAVMKGQGPFCPDGKFGVGSPSTFPHVTAVGGTQPYAEITPQPGFGFPRPGASSEQSWVQTEPLAPTKGPKLWDKAASKSTAFIGSSSGGFSNVFPQPAYQKEAVDKYLQKLADAGELPPESRGYNTAMRAVPDLSAQAENFCVNAPSNEQELECTGTEFEGCKKAALNTFICSTAGTSAAAPTFAGIIGQLNAARAKVGKGTLGFLNPLIYQHPEVFNDITQGIPSHGCVEHGAGPKKGEPIIPPFSKAGEPIINPGDCAKECQDTVKLGKGWYVKEGYDMVTGVGTPDYKKLKELVLSLP